MSSVFTRTGRRTIVLLAALATMAALLAPGPAQAKDKRELTVMTQNLYLGADLTPAIEAGLSGDIGQFIGAVAAVYGSVEFTDFETRSKEIVEQIKSTRPDIIGLQEVSRWSVTNLGGVSDPPRSYDFLEILLEDLDPLGYSVEAVSENAVLGPFPLAQCGFSGPDPNCVVSFLDRDVILVSGDTPELEVDAALDGNYETQFTLEFSFPPLPLQELSFNRGWTLIDGTFEGKKFRFVNTHLETQAAPSVQEAQAAEFLAGPAKTGGAVIAVGDFNSAADGSDTASYRMLTKSYFDDAWDVTQDEAGLTCCQGGTLINFPSALDSRIDLVLTHAAARTLSAEVIGDTPFQAGPPLWPSDHAGVVAVIRIH